MVAPMTMRSSQFWVEHFTRNSDILRVDWNVAPTITDAEKRAVLRSLQAWQLGETSDGAHLLRAATRYSAAIGDPDYLHAVRLFIAEEQKHGRNLGSYLDLIGEPRLTKDWGDSVFRRVRYFNTSMELWTIAVVTVESAAQIFYQALRDATGCELLKQICTDILIDEATHIVFQKERLRTIFGQKDPSLQPLTRYAYSAFFDCTGVVVWLAHRRLFGAGGIPFRKYLRKMRVKRRNVVGRRALFDVRQEKTLVGRRG